TSFKSRPVRRATKQLQPVQTLKIAASRRRKKQEISKQPEPKPASTAPRVTMFAGAIFGERIRRPPGKRLPTNGARRTGRSQPPPADHPWRTSARGIFRDLII